MRPTGHGRLSGRTASLLAIFGPPECVVLTLVAATLLIAAPLNTDAGYCLVASRRLLAGDRLYVDMIETNPPLIFWLMLLPAAATDYLAIGDERAVGLFAALTLAMGVVTAGRVLVTPPAVPRLQRLTLVGAFLTALVLPYFGQVAQREQLAAMLVFPYVALAARALQGHTTSRGLAVWCGALGGIGFAIKPFFLAAWLAVEGVVALSGRRVPLSRRPEVWTVAVVQAIYVVLILAITTDYFSTALPLARAMYGSYGMSRTSIVSSNSFLLVGGLATASIGIACLSLRGEGWAHAHVFGAAALGWLLAHVVQGKGWYYHLLPAVSYAVPAVAMTALAATVWLVRHGNRRWRLGSAFVLLALLPVGVRLVSPIARLARESVDILRTKYPPYLDEMRAVVDDFAPGEPVYMMSTGVWPAFPLVNLTTRQWPYHYHFLWPLPSLYAGSQREAGYRRPDEQSPAERQFFDTVVADLIRVPPRVLIVERGTRMQAMNGRAFDFTAYFAGSAEFRQLMTRYRRLGFIAQWEFFLLQ